ncbi:MAG: hypothetical protein ACPGJI_04065 [Kangiellaceae bacterium]
MITSLAVLVSASNIADQSGTAVLPNCVPSLLIYSRHQCTL